MVKPNQSVLHVILLGNTNSDISPLIWRTGRIKGVAAIPHYIRGILLKSLLGSRLPVKPSSLIGKESSKGFFAYQILE
jgi:hypothetical protein